MKISFLAILATLFLTFTNSLALAFDTIVSDIKDANVACMHMAKSEVLMFKVSKPQKIWRTQHDRDGKIKNIKALQLGQAEIFASAGSASMNSFRASITEGYQLNGFFENQAADGTFSLSVTSSYLPDGNRSNVIDHYNCSLTN